MVHFSPHHIHLMSHDAMAAGRFYQQMFDTKIVGSKGANDLPRCNVTIDDQVILISTVDQSVDQKASGPHSCLGLDHIGFRVDDMQAAVSNLKALGAEFSVEPRSGGAVEIAFVKAPDGVSIELLQYGEQK